MARTVSYLSHAAIRIGLVLAGAPLVWFAIVTVTEVVLCTGLWSMAYLRGRGAVAWTFSGARALRMLGFAWPLAMGGVAIQVQAHLDQILLAGFHGADALGIYSAAMRLVAVFGFVPIALHNAAAPEITRAHADDPALYARRLRDVYRMVLVVFLASAIPLSLLSESVILVVFGGSFSAASALVPLLMLRLLLISLATIRNLFITNEELFKHSLITACASLLLNAALNVVLIPRLGATGCVLAAVLSFAMNIGLDAVHKRARFNLRLLLSAIGLAPLPR